MRAESAECIKSPDGLHSYEPVDFNQYYTEYKCKLCGHSHVEEDTLGR